MYTIFIVKKEYGYENCGIVVSRLLNNTALLVDNQ